MTIDIGTTQFTPNGIVFDNLAVDQCADVLADKFAERIAPLTHYVGAMYGQTTFSNLPLTQKLFVLAVAEHATSFGDLTGFRRRRLASEALRYAQILLTAPSVGYHDRLTVAVILGKLATSIAHSYDDES